jgi:hypothetical protein
MYWEVLIEEVLSVFPVSLVNIIKQLGGIIGRTRNWDGCPLVQLVLPSRILFWMYVGASALFQHQFAIFAVLAPSGWLVLELLQLLDAGLVLRVDVVE